MTDTAAIETTVLPTSPEKKSPKKAAAKAKKPFACHSHPSTQQMVDAAIENLKERKGSSLHAIKKYIVSTYKVDAEKMSFYIRKYLNNSVESGKLIQTKGKGATGSFKLAATSSSKEPKAKTTKAAVVKKAKIASAKKNVVKKPSVAKKTGEEKKTEKAKTTVIISAKSAAAAKAIAAKKPAVKKPSAANAKKPAVKKPSAASAKKPAVKKPSAAKKTAGKKKAKTVIIWAKSAAEAKAIAASLPMKFAPKKAAAKK